MRRSMTMVLALILLMMLPGIALAAGGDLDPTFGDGGSTAPISDRQPMDIAVTNDGKIVAVGWSTLARWDSAGSLDSSFGSSGIASTYDEGWQVAVQPGDTADNLLVSRWDWDPAPDNCCYGRPRSGNVGVQRYTPSGMFDQGFSSTVTFDHGLPIPVDLEVQPDGRIIQAITVLEREFTTCFWFLGCPEDPRGRPQMLLRYHADGGLDKSFGDGGVLRLEAAQGMIDVAIQPDGRLVTASLLGGPVPDLPKGDPGVLVRRYLPDGSLDPSFVPARMAMEGSPQEPAVGIDATGRIVVAGVSCPTYERCDTYVSRLQPDGAKDPSFSSQVLGSQRTMELEIAPDAAIILIDDSGITRLDVNGQLDSTFGTAGRIPIEGLRSGKVQPDGKIVALRATGFQSEQSTMFVTRFLASGEASAPPPTTTGDITGSVTEHGSGTPIAGALIDCGAGGSSTSSSSGRYLITAPEGAYNCTATAYGYRPKKQHVTVTPGLTTTADFVLQRGKE